MTFDEAVTVIRKDIEEDNNWRSARSKMHETLNAALAAQHELQQHPAKLAEVAALTTKLAALLQLIEDRQAQLDRLDADYRTKEQAKQHRLTVLDEQIQLKEQKLAGIEARLDKLRLHLTA